MALMKDEMTTPEIIELVSILAWPFVAIVGLIILGPMHLLERLINVAANNISNFRRSMEEFKSVTIAMKDTIDDIVASARAVSDKAEDIARAIDERMPAVSEKLDRVLDKVKSIEQINTDIVAERIEIASKDLVDHNAAPSIPPGDSLGTPLDLGYEVMFSRMREAWSDLVEAMRRRMNSDEFDARMIGEMAHRLTDRRRRDPISLESAEAISRLSSQYRRFIAIQNSKEVWLTEDIYRNFIEGINSVGLTPFRSP